ncbi:MAG: penicillin-binding transpeptidase domain-containing protein, partial [Kiritimatiellaeota bacterium]|nr:penicillin-binding transpeptidase domain-containing protein [Kiritimatiellota bacterium]
VLDVRNGDVLAMASLPGHDTNDMSPAPSSTTWHSLTNDPGRPLFNRAIQGRYPPGSTFKVIVALGMLGDGKITGEEVYTCAGGFSLGPRLVRCSNNAVHGEVDLHKAIEVSCNGYFCWLGQRHGYEPVHTMARAFGFGARTGIDLAGESAGLLPDEDWKRKAMREPWYPGDTCLVCIGQGTLLVTPLQMAVATATIANGGRVVKPRFFADNDARGETIREFQLGFEDLEKVRKGMTDVIVSGTGRNLRRKAAGKTGTAEYTERGQAKKYAWMIAYAPDDNPEVAVAVVIEDGDSGGRTALPVVGGVLGAWFGTDER